MGLSLRTTVPLVGYSRPATMRSRVDFPPPEGPMRARQWTPSTSRLIPSITVCAPKRFTTFCRSSFILEMALEPARPERDGNGQDEIPGGEREIALERAVGVRIDLLRVVGEFLDRHDGEKRRILDHGGELPGQRRQDLAGGLRDDDVAVGL